MRLLSRLFKSKPSPPKTADDHLRDIEEELVKQLGQIGRSEAAQTWSKEEINTHLTSLEKIDELRERRKSRRNKSFLQTPAGASILTAIITITATQIPAMTQMFTAREAEETRRLTPLLELIAQDNSLSLDEKLAVINYVSSRRYDRSETLDEFLKRYRSRVASRGAQDADSRASTTSTDSLTKGGNPNNALKPTR